MLSLLAALALAATPTADLKLAAPAFSYSNLDEKTGELFVDALGVQLLKNGAQVISQKEIAAVVGLERQKQIMGCGDDQGSCMAELADALGVDGILTGSIGKTSGGFAFTLKVIASNSGKTLAAETTRVKTDDELLDWMEAAAGRIVRDVRQSLGRTGTAAAQRAPEPEAAAPAKKDQDEAATPSGTEVLWKGRWYPARILQTRADGAVRIHYEGYSDAWDEWVSPARLRGTGADGANATTPVTPPLKIAPNAAIEVEWNGSWYKATVLETRASDGHAFIRFDGYSDSWNEWVPPARMRPRQAE